MAVINPPAISSHVYEWEKNNHSGRIGQRSGRRSRWPASPVIDELHEGISGWVPARGCKLRADNRLLLRFFDHRGKPVVVFPVHESQAGLGVSNRETIHVSGEPS
jgi:hypothetical protein